MGSLAPVSLFGYALWMGGGLVHARKSGVSATAQGPLAARYAQHVVGTRHDEAAARILKALPGISRLSVDLVFGPAQLAHRLTGYVPKPLQYPYRGEPRISEEPLARVTFFDRAVEHRLRDRGQLVLLGAGFDTRAYRLPKERRVRAFEVDAPKTQAIKREVLARTHIDASDVVFVSADFEREDWYAKLVAAGFDPKVPALFIWEGVTMYLDRASVDSTLQKIASTAPGSAVVFDYFTTEPLSSHSLYLRYARAATRFAGEPLTFGIDSAPPVAQRVAELVESCGLQLGEHHEFGESAGGRAWGGFATGLVA